MPGFLQSAQGSHLCYLNWFLISVPFGRAKQIINSGPTGIREERCGVRGVKMKTNTFVLVLLLNGCLVVNSFAQGNIPFVYQSENTGADYPNPTFLSFSALPAIPALPDPFAWSDGRGRISNFSDWRYRRAEIGSMIQYYEIGQKPVRPDSIAASLFRRHPHSERNCERQNAHADFASYPPGRDRTLSCSDRYE